MRLPLLRAATAAICLTAATFAQQVQVYNFDGPRRASNLVLFRADMAAGVTVVHGQPEWKKEYDGCLLYTSPSPRDQRGSRMPSSA